jgi:hypothetical protein
MATVARFEGASLLREPAFELVTGHEGMIQQNSYEYNTCVARRGMCGVRVRARPRGFLTFTSRLSLGSDAESRLAGSERPHTAEFDYHGKPPSQ